MGWVAAASYIFQGVQAVRGFMAEKQAAKDTKRANYLITQEAEEQNRLLEQDAGKRALAERRDAARARSQQLALYLKSGVTLDGSPMLVMDETTTQGNENAQNIKDTAASQQRTNLLRAQAGQSPVQKADFFGTAAEVLGSAYKADKALSGK